MRLAVNASSLRSHGSRQVGKEIVRALARTQGVETVLAWVPQAWRGDMDPVLGAVPHRVVPDGPAGRACAEWFHLARDVEKTRATVFLSLVNAGARGVDVPQLVLVHQAFVAYPEEEWDFPLSALDRARLAVLMKLVSDGMESTASWTVQSEAMRRAMVRRWSISPDRIQLIRHGAGPVSVSGRSWRRGEPVTLVYPAHGDRYKNHVVLAGCVAALRRRGLPVRCSLTVQPEQVPDLTKAAIRLGVLNDFNFVGPVGRGAALEMLGTAFAAVIPSKLESFGLCYYEAMALGVPVVAADRDFAREACGEAALYAEADAPSQFADALERLWGEEGVRARMIAAARERIHAENPGWESIAAAYVGILRPLENT